MRAVLACLATLVTSLPVAADAEPPAVTAPASPKRPGTAVALSLGVTLGGAAVFASGAAGDVDAAALAGLGLLYIGPSTGQWYAGQIGGLGLVARLGAFGLFAAGVGDVFSAEPDCLGLDDAQCERAQDAHARDARVGTALVIGGVALWGASAVYDTITGYRATKRWNREHAVSVAPLRMPAAGGPVTGIAVTGTF